MPKLKPIRLIVLAVPFVLLALLLGAQALSNAASRRAPDQAAALFPANGMAKERLAFAAFQEGVTSPDDLAEAAVAAQPLAIRALATDPLAPKAHTIIALAQSKPEDRAAILSFASQINRRDLSLQGVVLQEHLGSEDYPAIINTLDQILRTHPDHHDDFFPLLLEAFKKPETIPTFRALLDGQSPWHERFLIIAVQDEGARLNLAQIRDDITVTHGQFDQLLVSGLAGQGEMELAGDLYAQLRARDPAGDERAGLNWAADYPPFDWQLAGRNNFRAQASRDGERLELFVRSGQGGRIARRVVAGVTAPFALNVELEPVGPVRAGSIQLKLQCDLGGAPFFEDDLSSGDNSFTIQQLPADCDRMTIAVQARALRGEPTLRAELSRIQIDPR